MRLQHHNASDSPLDALVKHPFQSFRIKIPGEMMIKIILLLIALLSGKYKIQLNRFFFSLQYLHIVKQTSEMNKEDFERGKRLRARLHYARGI